MTDVTILDGLWLLWVESQETGITDGSLGWFVDRFVPEDLADDIEAIGDMIVDGWDHIGIPNADQCLIGERAKGRGDFEESWGS
jgi:hypothetical protein